MNVFAHLRPLAIIANHTRAVHALILWASFWCTWGDKLRFTANVGRVGGKRFHFAPLFMPLCTVALGHYMYSYVHQHWAQAQIRKIYCRFRFLARHNNWSNGQQSPTISRWLRRLLFTVHCRRNVNQTTYVTSQWPTKQVLSVKFHPGDAGEGEVQ